MDATQDDVAVVAAEETRRTILRRLAWTLAWGLSLIALIVGIALTNAGSIDQSTPVDDEMYEVIMIAVWPAGLVLLAVGALGLIASALTAAVLTTRR
jgi:hypothetical protein